jgi:hypothetical protein
MAPETKHGRESLPDSVYDSRWPHAVQASPIKIQPLADTCGGLRMPIPLDPGARGRSVGEDALNVADIVVSATNAVVSRLIRAGTVSPVSHAALYVGGGQVVEAIGQGVVLRSLGLSLLDDRLAVAYRVRQLTADQGFRVRDFVGMQLGKPYSVPNAGGAGLSYGVRNSLVFRAVVCLKAQVCSDSDIPDSAKHDSFFCSQLVIEAFNQAGVPLVNLPSSHVAPADIPDLWASKALLYVGHVKG